MLHTGIDQLHLLLVVVTEGVRIVTFVKDTAHQLDAGHGVLGWVLTEINKNRSHASVFEFLDDTAFLRLEQVAEVHKHHFGAQRDHGLKIPFIRIGAAKAFEVGNFREFVEVFAVGIGVIFDHVVFPANHALKRVFLIHNRDGIDHAAFADDNFGRVFFYFNNAACDVGDGDGLCEGDRGGRCGKRHCCGSGAKTPCQCADFHGSLLGCVAIGVAN